MKHLIISAFLSSTLFFSFSVNSAEFIETKVKRVIDGDTVVLMNDERLRLSGIDAPESKQDFGNNSTEHLRQMVLGKDVLIEVFGREYYGRLIGNIYVSANRKMVQDGYAWAYDKQYRDDESEARENSLGIWSTDSPVNPKDWRKNRRNKKDAN